MPLVAGVTEDQVDTLKFFNEQVDELDSSTFVKFLTERGSSFKISAGIDRDATAELISPDRESTKAFVLTLRMFLQNNETISIANMAELIQRLPISPELCDRYLNSRDKINSTLDDQVLFTVDGVKLTPRHVLLTFLYGGLAHLNRDRVVEHRKWQGNPLAFGGLQVGFNGTVTSLLKFLRWARQYNREVLEAIGAE